jgi:arylformamidase
MHTYDITLTLSPELPCWPGDTDYELERVQKIDEGATANVSSLTMSAHMGTHVDAPDHFLNNGKTVEKLALSVLSGRAYVLYLPEVDLITAAILEQAEIPPRTRRVLFKTRNSEYWTRQLKDFQTDFVALSPDAAQYLVDRGVKLVGIDYLSIAPYHQGLVTHQILLKAGMVILEGLDLSAVSPGRYTLFCLPLKLAGSDGAPARAILIGV